MKRRHNKFKMLADHTPETEQNISWINFSYYLSSVSVSIILPCIFCERERTTRYLKHTNTPISQLDLVTQYRKPITLVQSMVFNDKQLTGMTLQEKCICASNFWPHLLWLRPWPLDLKI